MRLPLLTFTSKLYPDVDLSNVSLVACQHILGTTVDFFEELFEKGLKPENTHLLGKCYSTHAPTLKRFVERGVDVSPLSSLFIGDKGYDKQFAEYVESFANQLITKGIFSDKKRVIVLDDGGFLLQYLNDNLADVSTISGVEQTSSGFEKLKNLPLRFAVINIARSEAKIKIESPLIAKKIIAQLENKIALSSAIRVLVIGQGAIGGALKEQLIGRAHVFGCDSDAEICDFDGDYTEQLPTFDVIIGATGKTILTTEQVRKLKDGVFLVSASSSDREFPAVEMRHAAETLANCHADIQFEGKHLLNNGFPINFTGDEHSLPPEDAQLTRSLLLAGVCESVNLLPKGLHPFSLLQQKIVDEFMRLKNP